MAESKWNDYKKEQVQSWTKSCLSRITNTLVEITFPEFAGDPPIKITDKPIMKINTIAQLLNLENLRKANPRYY